MTNLEIKTLSPYLLAIFVALTAPSCMKDNKKFKVKRVATQEKVISKPAGEVLPQTQTKEGENTGANTNTEPGPITSPTQTGNNQAGNNQDGSNQDGNGEIGGSSDGQATSGSTPASNGSSDSQSASNQTTGNSPSTGGNSQANSENALRENLAFIFKQIAGFGEQAVGFALEGKGVPSGQVKSGELNDLFSILSRNITQFRNSTQDDQSCKQDRLTLTESRRSEGGGSEAKSSSTQYSIYKENCNSSGGRESAFKVLQFSGRESDKLIEIQILTASLNDLKLHFNSKLAAGLTDSQLTGDLLSKNLVCNIELIKEGLVINKLDCKNLVYTLKDAATETDAFVVEFIKFDYDQASKNFQDYTSKVIRYQVGADKIFETASKIVLQPAVGSTQSGVIDFVVSSMRKELVRESTSDSQPQVIEAAATEDGAGETSE